MAKAGMRRPDPISATQSNINILIVLPFYRSPLLIEKYCCHRCFNLNITGDNFGCRKFPLDC